MECPTTPKDPQQRSKYSSSRLRAKCAREVLFRQVSYTGDVRNFELGLTTATIPSAFMIDFKSSQNSTENRCCGTPPPEKQSWMTISNVERFFCSSACMAARLLYTQLRASSKKTRSSPGYARPKYLLAASYTAGSISTIVVKIPCRTKASAEIPAPSPLKSQRG